MTGLSLSAGEVDPDAHVLGHDDHVLDVIRADSNEAEPVAGPLGQPRNHEAVEGAPGNLEPAGAAPDDVQLTRDRGHDIDDEASANEMIRLPRDVLLRHKGRCDEQCAECGRTGEPVSHGASIYEFMLVVCGR